MWKYNNVNPKQSFPELEKQIEKYWEENNTFKKSIENREGSEEFNFYDGPPFATGLPHYGHLLAGTIKDVIPRYQTMKWNKVERIFWWDCHGLPIENIVEKLLNISWRDDIENKVWIDKFNETCRENVLTYTNDWKKIVKRMWRWVDVDNPYIAMDKDFMESVWWVFKKLHEKWFVYEWDRVVPYCPRCSTSLSNFEVAQAYKDKSDKTVTAKFKIWENRYILAWTTTPWTLVGNVGLAVGADLDYVEIKDKSNNEQYILAKDRLENYFKNEEDYDIIKEYIWSELVWIEYEPLLNILDKDSESINIWENAYKIIPGHHVTTSSGTGIVHIAPSFGEDDFQIGEENNLGFISHIWNDWRTHSLTKEWNGKWVFDFNQEMVDYLKKENVLVKIESITHSYPHCWRCDTPLIYRWIPAWYVWVSSIKDNMISANKDVSWIPENVWTWRFGKWLENARDWNISRNRYWATPIPVWQDEDKEHNLVIWTVEELYEYNKDYKDITRVIFVRHWRTDYNEKSLMDYKDKANLSSLGKEQSKDIANILKEYDIDKIYSSPLKRCIDTITPLAKEKNCDIEKVENFREITSPELQDNEFSCKNYKRDNGYGWWEKIYEVNDRVVEAFHNICEENKWKTIVICSHGDPLYLMRQSIYGWDYDNDKYTNGLYLENNPKKWWTKSMFSVDYIFSKSKKEIDLHKHFVDDIKLKDPVSWKTLIRIPELLDVWFDSGSMPYALSRILAKRKYNMSWKEFFDKMDKILTFANKNKWKYDYRTANIANDLKEMFKFPANFIAEWQDQTRWWFYTLMILGNALFKNTPYYNVIVNGIILAEDGKKMSKSLKNYPDPMDVVNNYWADSIRFYMMNSPAVQAQELKFSEKWVEETMRKVMLPIWNTYYFFTTYANIDNFDIEKDFVNKRENKLDIWIISELNQLIKNVDYALKNYTILEATKSIVNFMDGLTNWYIRRSRRRFWKSENDGDKYQAYSTLYEVLTKLAQVLAPVSPFITEYIYKDLTKQESVHLTDWPEHDENLIDENLNKEMKIAQDVVSLWLSWRSRNKIRTRQPLSFVKITEDLPDYYKDIIKEELNVKDVIVSKELAKKVAKPEWRKIWPKYWKSVQEIIKNAKMWNFEELEDNKLKIFADSWEFILEEDEYTIEFMPVDDNLDLESWFGIVVALDQNITDELLKEWFARDIVRFIQEWRKDADYNVADRISVSITWDDFIEDVVKEFKNYIEPETLSKIEDIQTPDLSKEIEIEDKRAIIKLKK